MYKRPNFGDAPKKIANAGGKRAEAVGAAPKTLAAAAPAAEKKEKKAKASAGGSNGGNSGLKAEAVFAELTKRVNADLVKKVNCIYRFDIDGGATKKSWIVNLKEGSGSVTEGEGKADCQIMIKDDDFVKLMTGKLNAQSAFMEGKFKIKGNMMLAQKLRLLAQPGSKL
jgi:putative sterol carrier protein